jgi:Abortive infection alpha
MPAHQSAAAAEHYAWLHEIKHDVPRDRPQGRGARSACTPLSIIQLGAFPEGGWGRREWDTMTDLTPVGDEQAKAIQEVSKAIQEALKTLQGFGGFLRQIFGTVPEDVVALLGGDWLKVRRAENLARMLDKARERLRARRVERPEPASLSIALPMLIAAADESRDELQDIWARLFAAAADPDRVGSFRLAFIETVKKMDPLDAAVLQNASADYAGRITAETQNKMAERLGASRDEVEVSISNLEQLNLIREVNAVTRAISAFGREFLRTVSD